MKYKSELEMCRDLTALISGILIPTKHKYIPEVPRCSYNDHADMLFIKENGNLFVVEYKLNNPKALLKQVQNYHYAIGIANCKINSDEYKYSRIFQYTGQDWELEKIADFITGVVTWRTTPIPLGLHYRENNLLAVYYWGYKNHKSSLEGGMATTKRISLFELFELAIKNIEERYDWQLDLETIYKMLGQDVYSYSMTKKYFNKVMNENNKEQQ